jgi:starch synthase
LEFIVETVISSSLCRFTVQDEHLVSDFSVKTEISKAFEDSRCFEFYLDRDIIAGLKKGDPIELFRERFMEMRNIMFTSLSGDDHTRRAMLFNDARLSSRLVAAVVFIHRAVAEGEFTTIINRRFVIIKELPGVPTILHVNPETTVISHVGQGPPWAEIPTVYLGLKTFDALTASQKKGISDLFSAFKLLLMIEERSIETGYTHSMIYPPDVSRALMYLVDEVIKNASLIEIEEEPVIEEKKKISKFTETNRSSIARDLDCRVAGDELNFNYERNIKAIKNLERYARRYKKSSDTASLREVTRLLVAASGHDIHEVRNRANIILERIFAPKEFDAPLATHFINCALSDVVHFSFEITGPQSEYILKIYRSGVESEFFLEKDINSFDLPLKYNKNNHFYETDHKFDDIGHFDFLVFRKRNGSKQWLSISNTSGRVNVIPDLNGEIILEVFADIHGHTKNFWHDQTGHFGLIYNENGEVIRTGRFSDISAHLEEIKSHYNITAIYLLGAQKRGKNKEDWAPEATSPSPFSPMSLVEIEPSLGGDKEFIELIEKAHSLDIKIIVDIIPHINRRSDHLSDDLVVLTYDASGALVQRASTDGRYGSWNDGKLLNYRKFEIWEWLADSITTLIEKFDIDGIRFDSAHAVPIMMKKNNFPLEYERRRSHEEMLEGTIIVNDREDGHYITTGYYDCACRDQISVPLHYYIMLAVERKLRQKKKHFFINIAECFWSHERFLVRTGLVPYNSTLFKICENIIHGLTDIREIYHVYDNYFPSVLCEGTELLGILGNHDERRALNTFGLRGLRAAIGLTCFMSSIIMDYEGSAEGEGWKVFLDNIYVNWNQFEYAANRSLSQFYSEWYKFHRTQKGKGYLLWANNYQVAAAMKIAGKTIWVGAFNFADSNQNISIQFDNPRLPIEDNAYYRLSDTVFSAATGHHNYYTGSELKASRINTVVSYTDRIKLIALEPVDIDENYDFFIRDSFFRICEMSNIEKIHQNFFFSEMKKHIDSYPRLVAYIRTHLIPYLWKENRESLELGLKRTAFYLSKYNHITAARVIEYCGKMATDEDTLLKKLGSDLLKHNERGALVFMSAEAEPFSKSGGLANVVYELPRELVKLGETVYVITGFYKHGDDKAVKKMFDTAKKYKLEYTGKILRFMIMDNTYEVGVHYADVEGVRYYLLDHHEFFDGLYWGYTAVEKIRRRVAFARSCAELICSFNLGPRYTFTNDAFAGIFNGIVRCDQYYINNLNFSRNTFLHIIHNGGWQYFDAYHRWENGFDLFHLFNLPSWRANEFSDPVYPDRLNCMSSGIHFADRTITVSPTYAMQIQYACDGLEKILSRVIGISNAIGRDFRTNIIKKFEKGGFVRSVYPDLLDRIKSNTALADKIEKRYPEIMNGPGSVDKIKDKKRRYILSRMRNKLLLQCQRNLKIDPDTVLFCMIHRVSEQKGYQLLLEASEGIARKLEYQGIIGGAVSSGDRRGEELAHGLYLLGQYYPEQFSVSIGFQDVAVPLMSSDIFLMPSMHEPGGISQLEAMALGNIIVARATGGLRDTVFPIRTRGEIIEGNGFLFSDYHSWAFYDAMERASLFFKNSDEDSIYRARVNAEKSIYFWDKPAREYVEKIYSMTETIRAL